MLKNQRMMDIESISSLIDKISEHVQVLEPFP